MTEPLLDPVKIRGSFTADPDVCNFATNRDLLPGKTAVFNNAESSQGSALIDAIFTKPEVLMVRVNEATITITKRGEDSWPKLAGQLIPLIKEVLESDTPYFSEVALEAINKEPDTSEMGTIITELLDAKINPAISSHGGWVKLVKIEGMDVYVEMGGGCQGCAASKATMKNGIEKTIREALPKVREVIDITDHSAGENPYYNS